MRGQNLFLSETKRIREGKPNLPHKPGGGQNLCCFTQKREDQLSGGFIHHFEPRRIRALNFFFGGKRFQCPGPGNTSTLDYWKKGSIQNAHSRTRIFKTRVPNANRLCFFKGAFQMLFSHTLGSIGKEYCQSMSFALKWTWWPLVQHIIYYNMRFFWTIWLGVWCPSKETKNFQVQSS